jgi:murein endopeptidase
MHRITSRLDDYYFESKEGYFLAKGFQVDRGFSQVRGNTVISGPRPLGPGPRGQGFRSWPPRRRSGTDATMGFRRIAAVSCCALLCGVAGAPEASARPSTERVQADRAIPRRARSIGPSPDATLVDGVELRERAALRLRWPDGPRWARPGLVSLLVRAAESVYRLYPGSVLLVGDLSLRAGGSLRGHASHRSGRDADVAFYYSDVHGNSVRSERLLPVRSSGSTPFGLRFDDERNWALVRVLVSDTSVQTIFVAAPLERRLIDYARRQGVLPALIARADAAMRQPSHGRPHDDHFHVRISE